MYKVLVVDDNKRELNYVGTAIEWGKYSIEIAGLFQNPIEAQQEIPRIMPDIIITDVVMPKMDGFQLVTEALQYNPDILTILMSCHDDFEYAKEAVNVNACSYLLKPIIHEELVETIEKIISRLDERELEKIKKRSMTEMIDQSVDILTEQFFLELSNAQFSGINEVHERMKLLKMENLLHCNICVVNIKFNRKHGEMSKKDIHQEYYNLFYSKGIIHDAFFFANSVQLFTKSSELLTCLLFLNSSDMNTISEATIQMTERIMETTKNDIVVGISDISSDILQMPELYSQSLQALDANFFAGINPVIQYHEIAGIFEDPSDSYIPDIAELSRNVKRLWVASSRKEIESFISGLMLSASAQDEYDEYRVKSIALILIHIVQMELLNEGLQLENIFPDQMKLWQKVFTFDKYFNIKQWLVNIIYEAIHYQKEQSNNTNKEIVSRIKAIIQESYATQITVSEIASKVFFSASYANSIFKEVTSKTIFEYLTEYRIEKAMYLLRQPDCTVSTISENVGYSNKSHFSFIFKKHVGLSPSDYRKRILLNQEEEKINEQEQ